MKSSYGTLGIVLLCRKKIFEKKNIISSLETEFWLAMEISILIKYQVSLNNIIQYKQNCCKKKWIIFGFPQSMLGGLSNAS